MSSAVGIGNRHDRHCPYNLTEVLYFATQRRRLVSRDTAILELTGNAIQQSQWLQNHDEQQLLTLVSSRKENYKQITENNKSRLLAERNGTTLAHAEREVKEDS
jgi:hypothetical protein